MVLQKKTPTKVGEKGNRRDFFLGYPKLAASFLGLARWAMANAAAFNRYGWTNLDAGSVYGTTANAGKQCTGDQKQEQFNFHNGLNGGDGGDGDGYPDPHQSVLAA